jgi:tetratricopeptide (TPR) repeat protein
VTGPDGRSFTDVGRAGGAVGPGGNAIGGRSNLAVASGPRGTAVAGSREAGAFGAGGAYGYRGYGAAGYRPYGYNAYGAYHSGWVHGYWNGHNDAAWGWRGGYWGLGAGLGWGLAGWGFGSALYGMGYMSYLNPYYAAGGVGAGPYDYSQPIDTVSAPAAEEVTSQSVSSFDTAREAFFQGNYDQALALANDALAKTPNDTALHEFRALCLFAVKRYDEAAGVLYAVLSVGPGWDWATLIGLYPDAETYTAQLRALEDACNANPRSAADYFVLAYHYLTQGHTKAAVGVLRRVVSLKPDDSLSAKLLSQLAPPPAQPAADTPAAPTEPPADATPPQGATLAGTWTAKPNASTSVTLNVTPGGPFTWRVATGGKEKEFSGSSTYGDGLLTLVQQNGPVLVGHVSWTDANHMTFRIAGDGPKDPGLSFAR